MIDHLEVFYFDVDKIKNFYFGVEKINGSLWYLKMHNPVYTAEVCTYQQDTGRVKGVSNFVTNWSKTLRKIQSIPQ